MVFIVLLITSVALFFLSPARSRALSFILCAVLAVYTSVPSVQALVSGQSIPLDFPLTPWGQSIVLQIDPIAALFILIINFTVLTSAIYGLTYLKIYKTKTQPEWALYCFAFFLLQLSMIWVCVAQNGIVFLVVWELMGISSFLLVLWENEKKQVLRAAMNYFIQMHIGALFLFVAFILLYINTGSFDFSALKDYFFRHPNIPMFLLFFAGFAIKAGFIPFHTWLPVAHPAAPANISGLMSGVMIKMGIFGILKVGMYLQAEQTAIGAGLVLISLLTGLGGIAFSIVQKDIKKMLAYSSIENVGIIGLGLGLGYMGLGMNSAILAWLGFAGALLHVLNHSLFKSFLFYGAGSVYFVTHTRNIEQLGGLMKKLPLSGFLFLSGTIAVCGLPPLNGFISEFLIFRGLLQGISLGDIWIQTGLVIALIGLTLIGGMAVFSFIRLFSKVFLGRQGESVSDQAREMPARALLPQWAILGLMTFIGLLPGFAVVPVAKSVALLLGANGMPDETPGTIAMLTPISLGAAGMMVFAGLVLAIRRIHYRKHPPATADTWGCAYHGVIEQGSYSASSFAENFTHIAGPAVGARQDFHPIGNQDYFPEERGFATECNDPVERKGIRIPVKRMSAIMSRLAVIQTGNTQHYILYAVLMIILLLALTLTGGI